MPPVTTAFAKNVVRRAFMQIADPAPDARVQRSIWEHFESRCAYCGKAIAKALKQGHIDHLVSASLGGRNHLSNRVLSCATCNEVEKRDAPWEEFLRSKCPDEATLKRRRARIENWRETHAIDETEGASLRQLAEDCAATVHALFDAQVARLKLAKNAVGGDPEIRPACFGGRIGGAAAEAQYPFTRLCFKADFIEPLAPEQEFRVDTPEGSFQMSKADFYQVFANVVASRSYREGGIYHYSRTPRKAMQFLLSADQLSNER